MGHHRIKKPAPMVIFWGWLGMLAIGAVISVIQTAIEESRGW